MPPTERKAPGEGTSAVTAWPLDETRVRAAFARTPALSPASRQLYEEGAARLMDRLELIRTDPALVLDLGAGCGTLTRRLAVHYPRARVIALDYAAPRLRGIAEARGRGWLRRSSSVRAVAGDAAALPLAAGSAGLIASNLALHWMHRPAGVLAEARRVLEPGATLLLATLGPDTLRELREAWATVDGCEHVHPFLDMHEIGDLLVGAGFVDVVTDVERVSLTYETPRRLLEEIRQLEVGNVARQRPRGLVTPRQLARVEEAYCRMAPALCATVELVFAHATAPHPAAARPHEIPLAELLASRRRR